jgi:hypothetical protein
MNEIPNLQNAQRNLRRLAAQRQLYSDAKVLQGVQVIISTPMVIAWSVAAYFFPESRAYAALWACLATLADVLVLGPLTKAKKIVAAKIQEEFDCEVLDLPWSDCKLGDRPEPEAMSESRRHAAHDPAFSALRDWYPREVGTVPIHVARLICQRSGCWYDRTLREKYSSATIAILLVGMLVIVCLAMVSGVTVHNAIAALLLLQPSIVLGVRGYREHLDAASNADRLRRAVESLWRRTILGQISPEESRSESRLLQNEIYDHRARSPLVFDWLYNRLRPTTEVQMTDGAAELVEEYLRQRPKTMTSPGSNPGY